MGYRVIKTIKGRQYIYEQSTRRVGGTVKTFSKYIGPLDPVHRTKRAPELLQTMLNSEDVRLCLKSKDFERFLLDPVSGRYPVAVVEDAFQSILPHQRQELFLSAETQRKVLKKHPEITADEYRKLAARLNTSETYPDWNDRHRVLISEDDAGWWRLVIKVTAKGELYLQTYHRSNIRQIRKIKGRE